VFFGDTPDKDFDYSSEIISVGTLTNICGNASKEDAKV
jgi:hypothetical protein